LAFEQVKFSSPDSSDFVQTHTATYGQTVRLPVRTGATCSLVSNSPRVWTTLLHRPDGDPTGSIKGPGPRILSLPHQKVFSWHLVSNFLQAFGFISPLLVFCALISHSRYFSCLFLLSLFLTVRILFFF